MDVFEVHLLSRQGVLMLAALVVVPALVVWGIARVAKQPKAGWVGLACAAISIVAVAVVAMPMRDTRVRLADDGLQVEGGRYAVTVPYSEIDVDGIALRSEGPLPRLGTRTNGIGLPGGSLGWFRSGDRRVFAAYSGAPGSLFIPTRGDFDLMLSPDDAEPLVDGIRQRAAPAGEAALATE